MKRKQFLLLLALLMTAATGAWAQITHRITATITSPDKSHTGTIDVKLPYTVSIGDAYKAITGNDLPNDIRVESLNGDGLDVSDFDSSDPWNTTITVTDEGDYTLTIVYNKEGINGNLTATVNISMAPFYSVKLADGTADAGNWTATVGDGDAQALPVGGLSRGDAVTLSYSGRLKVKSVTATHDGWNGDLSSIPASALEADGNTLIVDNGTTLKGRLNVSTFPYKVVIPDGATVTLDGVTILGTSVNDDAHKHAGITCQGDATIILADNSTNTVKGFLNQYPGIYVPAGSTLTILGGSEGNGKLTASSNGYGAGIGAGWSPLSCGNIEIRGGDITATGGQYSAGIGGGPGAPCGTITISGGTVTATGGQGGAGIGSGYGNAPCVAINISGGTVKATGGKDSAGIGSGDGTNARCGDITISGGTVEAIGRGSGAGIGCGRNAPCGNITITDGVTLVTATKGSDAPYSIGAGAYSEGRTSTCGTVTIGGTVYWQNNAAVDGDAEAYLQQATIVYPTPIYIKWNESEKKLMATEIPANAIKVTNADDDVNWAAGTYLVEGNVTINGSVTLKGNVELIIKDGAELNTNYIYGDDDYNLNIYGQAAMSGELNAATSTGDAIRYLSVLNIHSCKVNASSSATYRGGFCRIGEFNLYGGSVDATGDTNGYGLCEISSLKIWGGEMKAEGTGNSVLSYGITYDDYTTSVTVYGGKLWVKNADKNALDPDSGLTFTKAASYTDGVIETSNDGTDWIVYEGAGKPDTKYVRVGY